MATVKGDPEATLRGDISRYDKLIRASRAARTAAMKQKNWNGVIGAVRVEGDLTKARRAVVLALGTLQADNPAAELRAMRASALASNSFAAATELATQERAAAEEVEATTMSIADVIGGMSLPDRIALAGALADSVGMRLAS